jgi:eukaryotic-like serine/threonine-protein kinase
MADADLIPSVDDVLAEKYRIERVLGQGGMGIVLAAMHISLDERVAIKFLLPELAHDPALVGRFLREGRAAIKIRSEHVVKVLDVGTLRAGTPYMVMEYLHGRNFEELLEEQGRLPFELAVDHVLQATEALAEAHALGMVHRDLKPANLFLAHRVDGSPCVKVLDFGITKVVDPNNASFDATSANVVMGSPRYMSPEQMRSTRAIDARADIWALGVILQELITGVAPFDGTTIPDLLAAILQDPPPPLRQLRPDAPEGLERVIGRCLEKEPSARYADVAELTEALAPFGTASSRLSADRVSRVIRPRTPVKTSTSAPLVRNSLSAASSEFRSEPPTLGTVTVSAEEEAGVGGVAGPAARHRTVLLACGGLFFAGTMIMAMFGDKGAHSAGGPAPASEGPPAVSATSPLPSDREPSFPSVDLVPTASPDAFESLTAPSATPSSQTSAKRRLRAAASAAATAPKNDVDLFDGRK